MQLLLVTKSSNPSPDDIFIAVMGLTGTGKSTLISEYTGEEAGVGHMLESCTCDRLHSVD